MSVQVARRVLLDRLGAGRVALLAVLLDLPSIPVWADGGTQDGRALVLVGRHGLGPAPDAEEVVQIVLEQLHRGVVPPGVHDVAYLPQASQAIAEAVDSERCWCGGEPVNGTHAHTEICAWGGRGSGKTQMAAGALAVLGEQHRRRGYPGPLRALWLHSSLRDAAMKTARSLEEPLWGGLWRIEQDRTVATLSVGGADIATGDFVASQDPQAQERIRSAAHVLVCEEPLASLVEGGIAVDRYGLALTSTRRLPTPRRVSLATTNPGSKNSWVFERWLAPEHPAWCQDIRVSNRERLTGDELQAMAGDFQGSADLKARLVFEEWVDLRKGPQVTPDYDPVVHVAERELYLVPHADLVLGWDSGVTTNVSACVVMQRNGPTIRVFAALTIENLGLRRLINDRVIPWLRTRAPWVLGREAARAWLTHAMDPSMRASAEAWGKDIDLNPERLLRELLGGKTVPGTVAWAPRIAPLLYTLAPQSDCRLLIDPGPECDLVRRGLAGAWHYDLEPGTAEDPRDAPAKKERVFADVGDALAYGVGLLAPSKPARRPGSAGGRGRQVQYRQDVPTWR